MFSALRFEPRLNEALPSFPAALQSFRQLLPVVIKSRPHVLSHVLFLFLKYPSLSSFTQCTVLLLPHSPPTHPQVLAPS
jgi:hypothetical protein